MVIKLSKSGINRRKRIGPFPKTMGDGETRGLGSHIRIQEVIYFTQKSAVIVLELEIFFFADQR